MLKKIKQIAKIILLKKPTPIQFFESKLVTNELIERYIKIDQNHYEIELFSGTKLIVRNHEHSDYSVFKQIFNDEEYGLVLSIFKLNKNFKDQLINIIDAGANVGYTSVYFAVNLKNVKIYAVEPSDKNAIVYQKNQDFLSNGSNLKLYQKALSENDNKFYETESNFRDGKDWSITTKEVEDGLLEGISIAKIIKENSLNYISLLKIDIEGAERFIVKKENDLSYLKITQIIAIEIHDEFNIRASIQDILIENNFFLFESGELTIGINKDLLL